MYIDTMRYKCILVGFKINFQKLSGHLDKDFFLRSLLCDELHFKPMTVMILWGPIFVTVFLDMKLTRTKNVLTSMNVKEIDHVLMNA